MSTARRRDIELVQAQFTKDLSPRKRARMQAALAASPELHERYRRLQLAERVAAHGPERALEEPSPAEIERIAGGLGLLSPPKAPSRFRFAAPWILGASVAVAASLAGLMVIPGPDRTDGLVARGDGAVGASFAAYVLTGDGGFSRLGASEALTVEDRLKLRLSWAEQPRPLDAVWVALVPETGTPLITRLDAPPGQVAAVPGVVSLWGLAPGELDVYVVAGSRPLSEDELRTAVLGRPSAADLERDLGVAGVTRSTTRLSGPEAPRP